MGDRFGTTLTLIGFLEVGLVAMWFAVGSGRERRSYFWLRVVVASLGLPVLLGILVGMSRLLPLPDADASLLLPFILAVGVVALMLVPGVLYVRPPASSGPPDPGGGGGGGPEPPPAPPSKPTGGVPLQDAQQARARSRDHHGPRFDDPKPRRREREPARTPAYDELA